MMLYDDKILEGFYYETNPITDIYTIQKNFAT